MTVSPLPFQPVLQEASKDAHAHVTGLDSRKAPFTRGGKRDCIMIYGKTHFLPIATQIQLQSHSHDPMIGITLDWSRVGVSKLFREACINLTNVMHKKCKSPTYITFQNLSHQLKYEGYVQ